MDTSRPGRNLGVIGMSYEVIAVVGTLGFLIAVWYADPVGLMRLHKAREKANLSPQSVVWLGFGHLIEVKDEELREALEMLPEHLHNLQIKDDKNFVCSYLIKYAEDGSDGETQLWCMQLVVAIEHNLWYRVGPLLESGKWL